MSPKTGGSCHATNLCPSFDRPGQLERSHREREGMNAMVRLSFTRTTTRSSGAGSVRLVLGACLAGACFGGALSCTAGGTSGDGTPMVDPLGGAGGGVDMPPPASGGTSTLPPSVPGDKGDFIVDPKDVPVGM